MASFSHLVIAGNMTRDPQLRTTSTGTEVVDFGVAVNHYAGKDKEKPVSFFNVTAFGQQAKFVADYLRKGQPVLVSGEMRMESWTDKDSGEKKTSWKLVAAQGGIQSFSRREDSEGGEETRGEREEGSRRESRRRESSEKTSRRESSGRSSRRERSDRSARKQPAKAASKNTYDDDPEIPF